MIINSHFTGTFQEFSRAENSIFPDYLKKVQEIVIQWFSGVNTFTLYSSGTTSAEPKPFQTTREDLILSVKRTAQYFHLNQNSTLWCVLSPQYTGGYMMIIRALVLNCNLKISEPSSQFIQDLKENERIDFLSIVPLQCYQLLDNPRIRFKLNRISNILIGGAAIKEDILSLIPNYPNTQFFLSYGMTETLSHIAIKNLSKKEDHYNAFQDIQLGMNENSELIIQNYNANSNSILQTKDLVELLDENRFVWLGRSDFIINSGGVKVNPEQLESEIYQYLNHKNLQNFPTFYISSVEDERLGEKIVLVFSSNPDCKLISILGTFDWLKNPIHKPRKFYLINDIPYTNSGKVKRNELKKLIQEEGKLVDTYSSNNRKWLSKKFNKKISSKIKYK